MRGGMLLTAVCVALASPGMAFADDAPAATPAATPQEAIEAPVAHGPADQRFAIHVQSTLTVQATPGFTAPYAGVNSLTSNQAQESFDATLYFGVRPWAGGEIWANGEVNQGFGLSDCLGVAGFTSGEALKVGKSTPYLKLPRLFFRQTVNLGGVSSEIDAVQNQLRQRQTANRLVFTIGKLSVPDIFDTNSYAHDPRGDFFNWALIDTGTFDYAANAWGYTFGGAAEWYTGAWTWRAGLFDVSRIPNAPPLEIDLSQHQFIGEAEHRHAWHGHPGALRLTGFVTRARMARFVDAIALYNSGQPIPADLLTLRRARNKWGISANAEQEVSANFGLFARAGWNDGKTESYEYTDIDRTAALGGVVRGTAWHRAADRIGFAGMINGISRLHQRFLADGGLGVTVGDGILPHYATELVMESWYDWQVVKGLHVSLDYQFVVNPAYNRDRGPVHVFGLRLHGAV